MNLVARLWILSSLEISSMPWGAQTWVKSGKICCTVGRKAMCLAYKEVKIGSVTNTLNWRDKDVIVSKFNSLFGRWSGGVHLNLLLCLEINNNCSNILVVK